LQIARFALWREVRPTAYPRNVTVEKDGGTCGPRSGSLPPPNGDDRRVDAGRDAMRLPVIQVPVRKESRAWEVGRSLQLLAWPRRGIEQDPTLRTAKPATLWAAKEEARDAWVTVDLQQECEVGAAMLSDAPYGRTQAFDLEAQVGGGVEKSG